MIWTLLKLFMFSIARLVIPPPEPAPDPMVDVNEKCPACGHRDGALKTLMDAKDTILVQHHCKVCGARWYETPILKAENLIVPAGSIAQGI